MTDDDREDGGDAGRWERFGRSYGSFAEMNADPRYRADMARELAAHRRGRAMFEQSMDKWDRPEHWRNAIAELFAFADGRKGLGKETARDLASALGWALEGRPPSPWRVRKVDARFAWRCPKTGEPVANSAPDPDDPLELEVSTPHGVRFPPEFKALLYVEYAKLRLIDDRAPVKTVLQLFGVTDGTYRNWRRRFSDELSMVVGHMRQAEGESVGIFKDWREILTIFAESYRAEHGLGRLRSQANDPPKIAAVDLVVPPRRNV